MASSRGYNSYHGRTPHGKIVLTILLILIILAASGSILLQKYVVYDDSGKPHLELPAGWISQGDSSADSSAAAPDEQDLQITIKPPQKEETKALAAVSLSDDPTAWTAETETAFAAGQNGFAVTMKATGGRLQYASQVPGAVLSSTAAEASSALMGLFTEGYHGIARLSCFHDGLYANAHLEDAGLKNTGGYIFYDGNSTNWLDPAKQGTSDYLCAVAKECADLGFDEILLTDFSYPTVGKLNKIAYGYQEGKGYDSLAAFQAAQLDGVLAALKTALASYNVTLSVEVPTAWLTGGDETGSLIVQKIAARADRIYAQPGTDGDTAALSSAVTALNPDVTFVPELTVPPESGDYLLLP